MKRRSFIGYSLLLLASCSASRYHSLEKLSFAITDAESPEELQMYENFRVALADILGISVEFFPVENFVATVPAMISGQVDLAWAGPSEYLVLQARANAVPLVTLHRPDYRTLLIVNKDSDIQSLEDCKGKTIDMYRIGSTANYIGGLKILLDAGLKPQSDFTIVTPGTHTMKDLKSGKIDILARASHRYPTILRKEGETESDYRIIAEGNLLPSDIFVVSPQIEEKLIAMIQSRMLDGQDRLIQAIVSVDALAAKFEDAFFAAADDADYDMIREVYQAIDEDESLF
ncbi:MAG: PhnD/SsuA/transferrin family substrate-binding protein [Cyanobacteria bacterium SBLK]|nr:PhnD/SsuA/transferrin family substrate-binding protein [Cyanobacteria bacterium SBLK]